MVEPGGLTETFFSVVTDGVGGLDEEAELDWNRINN